MKEKALLFLGGIFVGGLIAWGLAPSPIESKLKTDERIFKFVDQDIRAYGEAKTPEEKIVQADALYAKAVVLFLVDLGIKVQGLPPEAPAAALPVIDDNTPQVVDEGDPSASKK